MFPTLHMYGYRVPPNRTYALSYKLGIAKTDHYNGSKHAQRGGGLRAKSKVRLGAGL